MHSVVTNEQDDTKNTNITLTAKETDRTCAAGNHDNILTSKFDGKLYILTLIYFHLIITYCRAGSCSQIRDPGGNWKLNFDDQVAVKYLVIYNVQGENGERIDGATVRNFVSI